MVNHNKRVPIQHVCIIDGNVNGVLRIRIDIAGQSSRHTWLCAECRIPLELLANRIDHARNPRSGADDLPVLTEDQFRQMAGEG